MNESVENTHIPVMLKPILEFSRQHRGDLRWALDLTFGRGGHTKAWLDNFPGLRVVAMDRDREAIAYGEQVFADAIAAHRLHLVAGSFHHLGEKWGQQFQEKTGGVGFDLILADLGVSSPQLDAAHRGFSFYQDGPLDMRMDQTQRLTAAEILNSWSERELVRLFQEWGEVPRPHRVVRALVHDRKEKPFVRTLELAQLIERVEGWHRRGHHPATRYFLALRSAVNDEISGLRSALDQTLQLLAPSGRLMVITFHSIEDRIVKYAMREWVEDGHPLTKRVVVPDDEECESNPRARSAKLRVFERDDPSVREEGEIR